MLSTVLTTDDQIEGKGSCEEDSGDEYVGRPDQVISQSSIIIIIITIIIVIITIMIRVRSVWIESKTATCIQRLELNQSSPLYQVKYDHMV